MRERAELVEEQREVVDRLERVGVVLAERGAPGVDLLAAERLGGLEVAKLLVELGDAVDQRRCPRLRTQPAA